MHTTWVVWEARFNYVCNRVLNQIRSLKLCYPYCRLWDFEVHKGDWDSLNARRLFVLLFESAKRFVSICEGFTYNVSFNPVVDLINIITLTGVSKNILWPLISLVSSNALSAQIKELYFWQKKEVLKYSRESLNSAFHCNVC